MKFVGKRKIRQRLRKILGPVTLTLASAIVLAAGAILILQAGWLNSLLLATLEDRLSSEYGGSVQLGELRGKPLSAFQIVDVRIVTRDGDRVELDTLEVRLRLLPLFLGRLVFERVELKAPKLILGSGGTGKPPSKESWLLRFDAARHGWSKGWLLRELRLEEVVVTQGQMIKEVGGSDLLGDLNLVFGFNANPDGYRLKLHRFSSVVFDPPLVISNLEAVATLKDGVLLVEGLELRTLRSQLSLSGSLSDLFNPKIDVNVYSEYFALQEFTGYPYDVVLGSLKARLVGGVDRLSIDLGFNQSEAKLALEGHVDLTGEKIGYDLQVEADGVEMDTILPGLGVGAVFDLRGGIKGRGIRPWNAEADVDAVLSRGLALGAKIDTLQANAKLRNGEVAIELRARGPAGDAEGRLQVDLSGKVPFYDLSVNFRHVDLSRFEEGPGAQTDLTGEVHLEREGPEAWNGNAILKSLRAGPVRCEELFFQGTFRKGEIKLTGLSALVQPGSGSLSATGQIDLGQIWRPEAGLPSYNLDFLIESLDAGQLNEVLEPAGPVSLAANFEGKGFHPDSISSLLHIEATASRFLGVGLDTGHVSLVRQGRSLKLRDLIFKNDIFSLNGGGQATIGDSLVFEFWGQVDPAKLGGKLGLEVGGGPISFEAELGRTWADPLFSARLYGNRLDTEGVSMFGVSLETTLPVLSSGGLSVRVDSLVWTNRSLRKVFLDAGLDGDDVVFLLGNSTTEKDRISLWGRLGISDQEVRLALDSLSVSVGQVAFSNVGPCRLSYCPESGLSVEQFHVGGAAGRMEARDYTDAPGAVKIIVDDMDLRSWFLMLGLGEEVSGTLDGEVVVSGNLNNPQVVSDIQFQDVTAAGVGFREISGSITYWRNSLDLDLELTQTSGANARVLGTLPLDFPGLSARDEAPDMLVDLSIQSEGIDLGFLKVLSPEIAASGGGLAIDVRVTGFAAQPEPDGWLRITNGQLGLTSLNQDFRGFVADVSFLPDAIVVERLGAEGGRLAGEGKIHLEGRTVGAFDLSFKFEDLAVVNLPELSANLNADLTLRGNLDGPVLEGQAELTRAVIELLSLLEGPEGQEESIWNTVPFLRRMSGRVRASASRNVWIRDRTLNVEISGDLDVVKEPEGFRFYGALDSRRGNYDFQNANFNIDQGQIQFLGKTETNPELSILGSKRVRLITGEPAIITVILGGALLHPQVTFESDPFLPEADILSYLVLGLPADVLSGSQGQGAGLTDQAPYLVLGIAANRLKRTIGKQLNLDVVEIDIGGTAATRLVVGKYIGQKFFVSYAQDLRSPIGGQEVTVEYELIPKVTLEAQQRVGTEQQSERQSVGLFWKTEW